MRNEIGRPLTPEIQRLITLAATEMHAWFKAYVDAGFTEEQAMRICARPSEAGPEVVGILMAITQILQRLGERPVMQRSHGLPVDKAPVV